MQFFTELPLTANPAAPRPLPAAADVVVDTANVSTTPPASKQPEKTYAAIWPDYFARLGAPDATSWHYPGHWPDTRRVWKAYYQFMAAHPIIALRGMRQFYRSLAYRVGGNAVGERSYLPIALLTPLLLFTTPLLALAAVSLASIPAVKRHTPPLFAPFTVTGWTNYCVMLALVFTLHGYRQQRGGLHPAQAARHSSKLFWNDFFRAELPAGHFPTEVCTVCADGKIDGQLPLADIVIKPLASGAGHLLRALRWDAADESYSCTDRERGAGEASRYTPDELISHLRNTGLNMVVERWIRPRRPLPVCSLRILTLCVAGQAELICVAFLPAPDGSNSTAYFDLDVYAVDYEHNTIGAPLAAGSSGTLQGLPLPELPAVIETCLRLHEKLAQHLQVSWDVIPAPKGPVYLEGNVFPPGCDYKLTLFKNDNNFRYLVDRVLGEHAAPDGTGA